MLEVVCWKWTTQGYRSTFNADTVNVLRDMIARHLRQRHRFTCITDDAKGIDGDIRVIPLWDDFAKVPNPSNPRNPSCYRRLRMFSAEARDIIGERILSLDLDAVITGPLDPLVDRPEDFVIWGGQTVQPGGRVTYNWYNGSLMLLRAGTRTRVWTEFNPATSPRAAHMAGCRGSDQGWISYCLGKNEATWGTKEGVYSFRNHIIPSKGILPSNARFVAFHGQYDPWHRHVQQAYPWVAKHYRKSNDGAQSLQAVCNGTEGLPQAGASAVGSVGAAHG